MTKRGVSLAVVLLLSTGIGLRVRAQAPTQRQSFSSTATAILVDVVVRDKHGRPITDLVASDFDVTEDGVGQKVDSFSRVSHGGGIGVGVAWKTPQKTVAVVASPKDERANPPDTTPDDATTALVFDHLSTDTLRLAQRATLDYVPLSGESTVRVGVFATDPGIRVVQHYTTDRTLVRKAVAQVQPSGTTAEEQKAERQDDLMQRRRELTGATDSAVAGVVAGTGNALARNASEMGERENELMLLQTELNMLRSFDNLDRSHQGYNTASGLLAVIESLAYFPGRKTIVFFSEGLPVSPALSARLDMVIDAANRANVTAYAVDANGLRAKSSLTAMRKEMDSFTDDRLSQLATGTDRTNQPLTMAFERVEDTLKLDSRTGLARLADETGGFLVQESNDFSSAFRRIDEDNQFHYLITYSPKSSIADGKFHAIQVKVHRSGAQVFARKGYRAIGAPRSIDAGDYETPALALLAHTPLPNAFPVHASGFSFPEPARPGLTPVVVHVGTSPLRFAIDQQRSTYAAQVAIVVRVRDGQGHEVQKVSQQYVLSGDAKDLEAAKKGDILFYREADLPPGVYTMETIVFDAIAQHGSARISTLTVPATDASPIGMSSLILVRRVEEVADASKATTPLSVGKTLLYPNLGEPIQRSSTSELPFYFTLYGDVSGATVAAQLLRNGQAIAEAPIELAPQANDRIQQLGRLPIGGLAAGTYELRVKVSKSGRETARSAFFTVSD